MNGNETKVAVKANFLALLGPASVLLSALLLIIKESPFYIDLSATAIFGLALSWRWKEKGMMAATALLASVLAYNFFLANQALTLWELGLSASISIAFLVTALASLEFWEDIRSVGTHAMSQLASFEAMALEAATGKTQLEQTLKELQAKYQKVLSTLQAKIETAERLERVLQLARDEMLNQTALRERMEQELLNEKRISGLWQEKAEDLQAAVDRNQFLSDEQELHQKQVNELKGVCKLLKTKCAEGEDKLHALTDQLDKLADRLKALQSERDELEKALDEALKPDEFAGEDPKTLKKTLCKVEGKYNQLREQFEEKDGVLAEVRRELFHTQEKLLLLQKQHQEIVEFGDGEAFAAYEKHIADLESLVHHLEQEMAYQEEVIAKLVSRP